MLKYQILFKHIDIRFYFSFLNHQTNQYFIKMNFISQLFYKITRKSNPQPNPITKNQSKQTPGMIDQSQQKQFYAKRIQQDIIQVHLNNIYKLKPGDQFYDTIQFIVPMINQKNQNNKYHIKQRFALNYFSSIQFILGKCKHQEEKCMICLSQFEFSTEIVEKQLGKQTEEDPYILPCSHKFHMQCLINLIGDKKWAKCPVCSTIFGKMTGDQPQGTMQVSYNNTMTLPGFQKGTIVINYYMQHGIRNGVPFTGTSRTAYLPNNKQGAQVLELLKQAFDRKLIFTVGRSVTSGLDNQTVWNGIHHKTSPSGGVGSFGYPDPTYLKRVKQQLAAKGVVHGNFEHKK